MLDSGRWPGGGGNYVRNLPRTQRVKAERARLKPPYGVPTGNRRCLLCRKTRPHASLARCLRALAQAQGNQTVAARALWLQRTYLLRLLKALRID
jgi:transcriptional regulator of acetoin/glycerol metabolism